MKYLIGDIVILLKDDNRINRYIIIATANQKLDKTFLESLSGKLNIKNITELADNVVDVTPGFKYKICKCADSYNEGLFVLDGKFIDILDEDELER